LLDTIQRSPAGPGLQQRLGVLLEAASTGAAPAELFAALDAALPLDVRYSPRRLSFHAQIRTETLLGVGLIEEAVAALRVADHNGVLDLIWLDGCPLFELVKNRPEYIAVRSSTAIRAERVAELLDT
jgi:serine/threonine-protein kinase